MKIDCRHGFFVFEETEVGQISHFMSLFGLEIERYGDVFTFSDLVDAPDYSLPGGTFLGCPTTEAFEGPPWDVMRANSIVYDFNLGAVVPIISITQVVKIKAAGDALITTGMIIPGSVREDGTRVTDYAAFYDPNRPGFKYSEVISE